MMKIVSIIKAALLCAIIFQSAAYGNTEKIDKVVFGSQRGTQYYAVLEPKDPPKILGLLFIGGEGNLRLRERGQLKHPNTLVRIKDDLLKSLPIRLVYVDAPDVGHTRIEDDYVNSVFSILNKANPEKLPVYVFGISWGTTSASAIAAANLDQSIHGLILLSALQRIRIYTVYDNPLKLIKAHTLIVQHVKDACPSTSGGLSSAKWLGSHLISSASVTTLALDGGQHGHGSDCGINTYHGFYGMESELLKQITNWMSGPAKWPN